MIRRRAAFGAMLAALLLAPAAVPGAPAKPAAAPLGMREGGFRLGTDVHPTEESVRLVVDPSKSDYAGNVDLALAVVRATSTIRLHAEDMSLGEMRLTRGTTGEGAAIALTHEAGEHGLLTLKAARPLAPGAYRLTIAFTNDFNTQATSLYRLKSGDDWYAFTQFEADDAREAFPCFDEPEFKIPWQLTVVVRAGDLAVGNTPVAAETSTGDTKTVVFERTKPMPSYLVALATGPLETVPIEGMSVPGRVVTVKGASRLGTEAARVAPGIVNALEKYFGRPYPFAKLDLIAVPEFWPGAMENAGAITFVDRSLLLDPARATVGERRTQAEFIAHEVAHMWFGDLVTMRWWDDLWLNESFATWMGQKIANETHPELGIGLYQVDEAHRAMASDGRLTTRAIRQPVTNMANLLQSADVLAYQKGETVLGMFEHWMGEEAFRAGVRRYLAAHAWGNATAADLWSALSASGGHDVARAMATFLDQPGMPLVTVEPAGPGKVRLSQERFLPAGARRPPAQTWDIPMVLKFADASGVHTRSVVLAGSSLVVELSASPLRWVDPNADAHGYYRWRAPAEWMKGMAEHGADQLDGRERMDLAYDARGLVDAGAMHADEYLALVPHLVNDAEPMVVGAALDGLEEVRTPLVPAEEKPAFARYVRGTVGPALASFGRAPRKGEAETVALVRPRLLTWMADEGQDAAVRAYGDSLAHAWLAQPSQVAPELAQPALAIAALRPDRALRDTLRARFESAPNPGLRRTYLAGLISFEDSSIVAENLDYALSGPLKPQEVGAFLRGPSDENRDLVWSWLEHNYDRIMKRMPPMYAVFMPYVAGGCSNDRLKEADRFFGAEDHRAPGVEKELDRLGERVGDCLELREREGPRARAFFERLAEKPTP